MTRIPSNFI